MKDLVPVSKMCLFSVFIYFLGAGSNRSPPVLHQEAGKVPFLTRNSKVT